MPGNRVCPPQIDEPWCGTRQPTPRGTVGITRARLSHTRPHHQHQHVDTTPLLQECRSALADALQIGQSERAFANLSSPGGCCFGPHAWSSTTGGQAMWKRLGGVLVVVAVSGMACVASGAAAGAAGPALRSDAATATFILTDGCVQTALQVAA